MSHCTRHLETIDGVTVMVINPCCETHAPQQPYISRATIAMKAAPVDRKRHTAHSISERG